jgi:hypothetical protein
MHPITTARQHDDFQTSRTLELAGTHASKLVIGYRIVPRIPRSQSYHRSFGWHVRILDPENVEDTETVSGGA